MGRWGSLSLRPTRMEVRPAALAANFAAIRAWVGPGCMPMAVVKADGYGTGVMAGVRALQKEGCQRFCVATPDEAVFLRDQGVREPLLVMGASPEAAAEEYVARDIAAALTDLRFARAMSAAAKRRGKPAQLHLKVDTGMGRIGFLPQEIPGVLEALKDLGGVELEGLFTHFATADERHREFTETQFRRYGDVLEMLRGAGLGVKIRHVCNSAGIMNFPAMHLDAVRPGLILYGMEPSSWCDRPFALQEVYTVKTAVAVLRELVPGWGVSYGLRYSARGHDRVAVLPIGYADGYSRVLTGKASVLVRGVRAPVVGSICMDQTMVDVSHIPGVDVGDEVVLVGSQGSERLSPEEVAGWLGSINYEIPCMFTPRVPRVAVA